MGERGAFVFVRYCVKGAQKWLEAQRMGGGTVVLWVGKAGPNPDLPSYKRRPYKVRKVTGRARKGGKKQEGGPAADAVCAAKQRVGKGKDAGHKAKATGQAAATTGRARGAKSGPKPRAKAGSTPARRGGAAKRGKNGVGGGLGRGRGSPSTSGSTSI